MSARTVIFLAAVTLAAQPALAERAKVRTGSSSAAASSGKAGHSGMARSAPAAARRSAPAASASTASHGRRPGPGATARGPAGAPTSAQLRHPRAGTGRPYRSGAYYGYRGRYGHGYGYRYGYPYWGWGYPYYWYGGGYPYYGYGSYGYPYSWGYPYGLSVGVGFGGPYWGASYSHYVEQQDGSGALRVLVDPPDARVFVDGDYVGTVDDFDGMFQRLRVAPGRHEIVLELEGYQTARFRVLVAPDQTIKLRYKMVEGSGESVEELPGWASAEAGSRSVDRSREAVRLGTLRLSVSPQDASVYIDGQFFGTGQDLRSVPLPAGPHRLEVVMPGFRPYERDVEIDPSGYLTLEVSLDRS